MGGGQKRTADVAKGEPFDLLAAIAEAGRIEGRVSTAQAAEFCARTHSVPFRTDADVELAVGAPGRLVLAEQPVVLVDNQAVGTVDGPIAIAMRGCLEMGYELAGSVQSIDSDQGRGTLSVTGVRRQVA